MKYEVIDNYLPKEQFEQIKNLFLTPGNLPWYYVPYVTWSKNEDLGTLYFAHMFYNNNAPISQQFSMISPLLEKINPDSLIRVKGNLYPNIGKGICNEVHKDYEFEHKGAIYYINTNNGPTVLDDGTKIDCVENRILFFESHKNHNSTYCTDQKVRMNININYF
jgi:hypothetical protein